jgi:thioredoxin 2
MSRHFRCTACGRINRVPADKVAAGPKCGSCKTRLDVTNAPFHVGDTELTALIEQSPVPVLVDFYADWCQPCRMVAPVLQELARRHAGEIFVAKVDTERDQRWAGKLSVSGIPAIFLFKNGQVVDKVTGARPLQAMEAFVAPQL